MDMAASSTSTKPATSSWGAFIKAILIPLFLAGLLYLLLFHAIIPLYRRYRTYITRYSSYTPLGSSFTQQTTSIFAPLIIDPGRTLWGKVKERLRLWLWRWAVPGMANMNLEGGQDLGVRTHHDGEWEEMDDHSSRLDYLHDPDPSRGSTPHLPRGTRRTSDEEEMEGGLFDAETGQSMVGFDVRGDDGDGRGYRLGRRRAEDQLHRDQRGRQFAREMMGDAHVAGGGGGRGGGYEHGTRLSVDLERSFGDESADDDEEEDAEGVVVGR